VGGAIANDIHGKNHHAAGTFGCHVPRFELIRSNGQRYECTATQNQSLYEATIGGLGLTGLISWAEVQLRPIVSRKIKQDSIKFNGLNEFFALSRESQHMEYTVAWIDCVATGKNFARGIFIEGDHSDQPEELKPSGKPKLTVPVDLPAFLMNKANHRRLQHRVLRQAVRQAQDGTGRLRAFLLSARLGPPLESRLRQARFAAVPERHAMGAR